MFLFKDGNTDLTDRFSRLLKKLRTINYSRLFSDQIFQYHQLKFSGKPDCES